MRRSEFAQQGDGLASILLEVSDAAVVLSNSVSLFVQESNADRKIDRSVLRERF